MNSGIYAIVNDENGNKYIGSSVDIGARWRVHLCNLRKNKHHSSHLQNAWNKYGPGAFSFTVVEKCDRDSLVSREQEYLDSEAPEYNVYTMADSPIGHSVSPETRAKMSRAMTGRIGPNRGKKMSEETKRKISEAKTGHPNPHDGRKKGEEEKRKISLSLMGNTNARKSVGDGGH